MAGFGDRSFDLFQLPEEHEQLRAVLRDLCETEIAPYATDVDEHARFPERLSKSSTTPGSRRCSPRGVWRPGRRRGCDEHRHRGSGAGVASSSLIPGVNKLGTIGLLLRGSDDLKKQVLPSLAAGDAMASYALSEREAGSDPAAMRTRVRREGDGWVLDGAKCWITNGGKSTWYTVMAVTDPDQGPNGISAFVVHKDDPGFTVGTKERKLGIKGSPTTELYFEECRIPGDRIIGEPGTGLKTALASLDHTRPAIGAQAVGIAQGALDAAIAYTKERRQFRRPVSDFQGVQFMLADMAMKIEAARILTYTAAARAERGEPA